MRSEMARGAAWMVLFRLFDRSIGIVSMIFLARLLVPADFGLVAMAMSVISIIELATAFSFEIALIQKPDPGPEHYDTAWTLNIMVATGGALVSMALAHPAASFYGDPRLAAVMVAIGGAWLVSGFENVGTVNFRRTMNFAAEFRLMAAKRMVGFVVTLAAALMFRSYWALVIGMSTGRVAGVALSYLLQPLRPRLSLACTRELFSFSGWLLINNILSVLLTRLPHFVVGRVYGAQALGAYTVGSEIAQLPHTELVAPINRAMFPGYARLVNDLPLFRRICLEATSLILLVVLPISVGGAVLAEPLVRVLLGVEWHHAVPVLQILVFAGAVSALTSNNTAAYIALGRPRLTTFIVLTRLAVFGVMMVALMVFAKAQGVATVAHAELTAAGASFLVSMPILFSAAHMSVRDYVAALWRPVIATGVMFVALSFLTEYARGDGGFGAALIELVVSVAAGASVYAAALVALWYLAGRPQSVETLVLGRAWTAMAALVARR